MSSNSLDRVKVFPKVLYGPYVLVVIGVEKDCLIQYQVGKFGFIRQLGDALPQGGEIRMGLISPAIRLAKTLT